MTETQKNAIISVDKEKVLSEVFKGGKHSGFYKTSLKKSKVQLEKSIKSHLKQVEIHTEKINNPEKYDSTWSDKTEEAKKGLLKKWRKDAERNLEQAEIERWIKNGEN